MIFFICRSPEFLPVSGLSEPWCTSTLGAALLCSSRAGSDLGLVSRLVWRLCQVLISKTSSEWEHPFYNFSCPCWLAELLKVLTPIQPIMDNRIRHARGPVHSPGVHYIYCSISKIGLIMLQDLQKKSYFRLGQIYFSSFI